MLDGSWTKLLKFAIRGVNNGCFRIMGVFEWGLNESLAKVSDNFCFKVIPFLSNYFSLKVH